MGDGIGCRSHEFSNYTRPHSSCCRCCHFTIHAVRSIVTRSQTAGHWMVQQQGLNCSVREVDRFDQGILPSKYRWNIYLCRMFIADGGMWYGVHVYMQNRSAFYYNVIKFTLWSSYHHRMAWCNLNCHGGTTGQWVLHAQHGVRSILVGKSKLITWEWRSDTLYKSVLSGGTRKHSDS